MDKVSPSAAIARVDDEFHRRGWRDTCDAALHVVRAIIGRDGVVSHRHVDHAIPAPFLSANRITRTQAVEAVWAALAGTRVTQSPATDGAVINVTVDSPQVFIGRNEVVNRKTKVSVTGQFAGNIDSPGAQTNVGRQQQLQLSSEQIATLRQHLNNPEVQAALSAELPPEEKRSRLASALSKVAGFTQDVAANIAANLIAGTIPL